MSEKTTLEIIRFELDLIARGMDEHHDWDGPVVLAEATALKTMLEIEITLRSIETQQQAQEQAKQAASEAESRRLRSDAVSAEDLSHMEDLPSIGRR